MRPAEFSHAVAASDDLISEGIQPGPTRPGG